MKSDAGSKPRAKGKHSLDEEAVASYLLERPQFFINRAELLLELNIPHESGGAVSLLEKQVAVHRQRHRELQDRIDEFIATAKENDKLFEKTRLVVLALLETSSLTELARVVREKFKTEFSAHASKLVLISERQPAERRLPALTPEKARKALGEQFGKKRAYCCELSKAQAQLLFARSGGKLACAAIIPIHLNRAFRAKKGLGMPVLLIGSARPDHFNSGQDTLFLDFIGEVLAVHIARLVA